MNNNSILAVKKQQVGKIFEYINKLVPQDVLISCPEWAEKNRYMNHKVTQRTGPFSFENAPYCREIVDCFSKNNSIREVAIMKGVQLGLTTSVIENVIGYTIDSDPSPMMFVFPTDKDCEEYKKIKIDNLIDNSGLRRKILAETENRNTRRTGDTAFMLEFPNGFLKLVSARKGNALRSTHIKKLMLDEVDGYPEEIKNEGSPIDIAKKRTDSYSKVRKICYNSTPTKQHKSKIKELYEKGDMRKYFVPCPFCGEMQELVFYVSDGGEYSDKKAIIKEKSKYKPYGLIFNIDDCREGDYSSVVYRCKKCGEDIKEFHKKNMELKGEWRPTSKSKVPHMRSYHISALYSLTKPWEEIVLDYVEAGTDPKKLQTFYNLDLGLTFADRMGGVEYQQVHRLKDDTMPNNVIPKEALFLTAAADVQRDRIEVEIKAWGDRFRCWGIDHRIFYGDTGNVYDPCYTQLAAIKDELFPSEKGTNGKMAGGRYVELMLVDSGDGENTDTVYNFCYKFGDNVIYPLKGFPATPRTREKYKINEIKEYGGLPLVNIYVDLYKNMIAKYFSQEERPNDRTPDGWFTFAQNYSDEYFRQLTTERRTKIKTSSGVEVLRWVQHGRNEAFDLNVYNFAACDILIAQWSSALLELEKPSPKDVFEYLKQTQAAA